MRSLTALLTSLLVVLLAAWSGTDPAATYHRSDPPQSTQEVDREYTLEATILGYKGVGGAIDGVRNPRLEARKGESVRITIINGETMAHDLALEKHGVKTVEILDAGSTASVTFVAEQSDTYFCTIPGHRAAGMEGRFEIVDGSNAPVAGIPVVKNGRPLNLGFETGTLQDWTATGDAFTQPVQGDAVAARTPDMHSGHEGMYWISSGEAGGHRVTGTLTSVPFEVTHPYASFLVSGGALRDTRVELVLAENDSVFFDISGYDHSTLRPVVVDLRPYMGKDISIRIIDGETGISDIPYIPDNKWAHINFDGFVFHSTRPSFPNELDPQEIAILPPLDPIPNAGLSPQDAAAAMTVPEGFKVTLAASEPDVVQPIAFAYDDRGRLWVVEAKTYPVRAPEGEGQDRILIFEDTDGDGTLDKRKIFMDGLNLVSGIELGFGGVWVGAAPYLMFIPIDEKTDKPAGPPQILLDGWGYEDTHEMLNTFRWGPDGWLYGNHGVFTHSNVGKPGAPDSERVRLNGSVWRYHPTRHVFEVFAEGFSNPWGIDFNDYGHAFITACVIPHLYYVIPGARYERQAGEHFNPYIYDDIKTVADHVHWIGDRGPHAGNNRSGSVGGGHAHAGAMVYLGGSWPEEYRNQIFMHNIHGFRANMDKLERKGSGYVGTHGEDFLFANDSWSQMLNFRYGPDGSVHIIDWYDKNQCHSPNPDLHEKSLGRIFKVSYKDDKWVKVNLRKLSSSKLVELQLHKNDWYVQHARRILQERGTDAKVHAGLRRILNENPDVTRKLRALWALHVTDGLTDQDLIALMKHESEYVRAWAVQLLAEDKQVPDDAIAVLADLAARDTSPVVRLQLAAALQRIEPEKRWDVLAGLYSHPEDADDHNLPLMIWYAAEPMATVDMDRALEMAMNAKIPTVLPYTVRRIAALGTNEALRTLAEHLGKARDPKQQAVILEGVTHLVHGADAHQAQ